MPAQIFTQLLNPAIGLLLAASFYLLWRSQRSRRYLLVASAGYVCNAAGFLFQDVFAFLPGTSGRVASNLFLIASAWLLASAILQRFQRRTPHALFGIIAGAAVVAQAWYLYAAPDLTVRVLIASAAFGLISLLLAVRLAPAPKRHLADKLLFWFSVVTAVNFLARPALILWLSGTLAGTGDFRTSLYWTTVQFSQAIISVTVAVNLMVAVAIDLLADVKREASTDQLSGLLNRRGFEARAAAALAECQAAGQPGCFLIADLDHFKRINDTCGHLVGDSVIRMFGQLLRAGQSPGMVAGRIGGEEFAVFLPSTDLAAGRLFAESLRAGVTAAGSAHLPRGIRPTVSIGLCAADRNADLFALLGEADDALYEAKRAGRDRVHTASQVPHAAEPVVRLRA
jgi:diguanylate cyclase (GGDEF)-like protein